MIYNLWLEWRALGKPPQVSTLVKEITSGYGGLITALLKMESWYEKVKQQIENQSPKK